MNYPRKNLIYLKQAYTFQSNQIKFENQKFSLSLKRFIVHFLIILNPRKPNVRWKRTSRILLILISTTTNLVQHGVLQNLRNNKNIVITKPDKENGVVIFDRKLYNNVIEEIISDTSKFEKLNEDPTLKREASIQRLLRTLKQKKNFFNETEYDKFYSSGSAPARIYGTAKAHKLSSSDSFPKLRLIVSSIGTFNYNLARFLCDLPSPLVLNDTLAKILSLFFLKLTMQIFSKNFLFPTM